MTTTDAKMLHIATATQIRPHRCHWPTCQEQVKPALWGCTAHWMMLPKEIRVRIWNAYVPGQEIRRDPSEEYLSAAAEAQAFARKWIEERPVVA